MLQKTIIELVDSLYNDKFLDKNLIIHCYLRLLDESLMAGNIFMCRYRVKFLHKSSMPSYDKLDEGDEVYEKKV